MKKTIKDFDLEGKRVIIRCDLNVPMKDGIIEDDTRIKASIRTIKYAIRNGAKVILLSHLGKVKEEKDKKNNSLYPVSFRLSNYLGKEVKFSSYTSGPELKKEVDKLNNGDVLLVENTRFEDLNRNRESSCNLVLARSWASCADIYINDAYGSCHRKHASVTGIPKYLPNGIGFLIEREIKRIDNILDSSTHPFITILGGKKVDDKIELIESLVKVSDKLLIGGAMSFTFQKALGYNVGSSIVSDEHIDFAKKMLSKYGNKIVLPKDYVVEDSSKEIVTKNIEDFEENDIGYDIGNKTIKLFDKELEKARRVVLNGPMGMFEDKRFQKGTDKIFKILAKNRIKTVVGGGDSASAAVQLGYKDSFYHISTGGGATMEYLAKRTLPGLEVIDNKRLTKS